METAQDWEIQNFVTGRGISGVGPAKKSNERHLAGSLWLPLHRFPAIGRGRGKPNGGRGRGGSSSGNVSRNRKVNHKEAMEEKTGGKKPILG